MSKIRGNQDAVEVSSILGIDVLKHQHISFRETYAYLLLHWDKSHL